MITQKYVDYQTQITEYNFVNGTVKTEYPNGTWSYLYSNNTVYQLTPNSGSYDV